MTDFHRWWQGKFGRPFPIELQDELQHAGDDTWSSDPTMRRPMTPVFTDGDYTMCGYWGRGINSYAVYFIQARGPHRCFFRLACGGAYGDWDEDAKKVIAFLSDYEIWRKSGQAGHKASTLIHNMGADDAELDGVKSSAMPWPS